MRVGGALGRRSRARVGGRRGSKGEVAASAEPRAPVARVDPVRIHVHGAELVDPYAWLRDRESPEVRAYLEAENAYTEAKTAHLAAARGRLYDELLGRIREDDVSAPVPWGPYLYYSRTEKGRPYAIHCRRRAGGGAPEEVLLDENELARGHDFFDLGDLEVSPDHRLVAYAWDADGDEAYTIDVLDLETAEVRRGLVEEAAPAIAWASDGRTFFAVTQDENRRPYRVVRLSCRGGAPEEVFREPDERFFVDVGRTRSGGYVLIESASARTTETWAVGAATPETMPRRLAPRRRDVEAWFDHSGEHFWILTNLEAKDFRLMRAPVGDAGVDAWRQVVPHREGVKLEGVDLFEERVVLVEREDGLEHLRFVDKAELPWTGETGHRVALPDAVYALAPDENPEPAAARYRFVLSSLVRPATWYDYDPAERRLEAVKVDEVVGGHDPDAYVTERLSATAPDGVRVPVSLARRRDVERGSDPPCLLYGYGAYGISIDPGFSPHHLSLLERGFVYAIAHVRGGAELGEWWHEAGRMEEKENTFDDFVAAAECLVEAGWTRPGRLAIRGGSAGGLLIGAVLNRRPELFAVALAHVPFVDVLNTMLDPDLPLTVTEYEEWGDPAEREAFERLRRYAPYENVAARNYPDLLVTAGWNDPRVQYWEAAKWVAKLRATKTDDRLLLLKTHLDAGHFGGSGRYREIEERAFELAFLFDRLGVEIEERSRQGSGEGSAATPGP